MHYELPSGQVGARFLNTLTSLTNGIVKREHNSEKMLLFAMVILPRTRSVNKNKTISQRLTDRMDRWDQGHYNFLVDDTESTLKSRLRDIQRGTTKAQRLRQFNQLMLQGEMRRACRYLTEREETGVLDPSGEDGNGNPVFEVLSSLHPPQQQINAEDLHEYEKLPKLGGLQITAELVADVA